MELRGSEENIGRVGGGYAETGEERGKDGIEANA